MIKIIIGIIFVFIGIVTVVEDAIPIIWISGFSVGTILIAKGLKEESRSFKSREEHDILDNKEDKIHQLLSKGETCNNISTLFYKKYKVPPMRTIQFIASILRSYLEGNDESQRLFAINCISNQKSEYQHHPKKYINQFNYNNQVFWVDESVTMYSGEPSDFFWMEGTYSLKHAYLAEDVIIKKEQATEGSFILHKEYLYFFENKSASKVGDIIEKVADKIVDKVADKVPLLKIGKAGYQIISGVLKELSDYFNYEKIKELEFRYSLRGSKAIPLIKIESIEIKHNTENDNEYLVINARLRKNIIPLWFGTTIFDLKEWPKVWAERIDLACIAAGVIIETGKQKE